MRSEIRFGARLAALVFLAACTAIPAASAAVDVNIDFLWAPASDDSTQIYLHVSNMAWEPPKSQVRRVYPKLHHPEWDYPVLVFMAHESGKSLTAVWKLREGNRSWALVMRDLGIPRERLVMEIKRKPEPQGVAHGYWRKHSAANAEMTDDDIYYWVNVHALSRYFEAQPDRFVIMREDGRTFKAMAATSFQNGQGKAKHYNPRPVQTAGMSASEPAPGASQGNGKAKGRKK